MIEKTGAEGENRLIGRNYLALRFKFRYDREGYYRKLTCIIVRGRKNREITKIGEMRCGFYSIKYKTK